jgi:CHAT domain-containing protein
VVASGDELLGLVRGLIYAGAQSVLLTLWDVHDRSSAEFMKLFYQRLLAHPHKGAALQGAMQELREQYPHPYHWAPFTLLGRWPDLNPNPDTRQKIFSLPYIF